MLKDLRHWNLEDTWYSFLFLSLVVLWGLGIHAYVGGTPANAGTGTRVIEHTVTCVVADGRPTECHIVFEER